MQNESKHYKFLACGGTFDLFHAGHKAFLTYALQIADTVLIGITSDTFAGKKNTNISPYHVRYQEVAAFIASQHAEDRVEIEKIDSNTIPEKWFKLPIEIILVTESSEKGAEEINLWLQRMGKKPLTIQAIPLSQGINGDVISSSAIREGFIDRDGTPYVDLRWLKSRFFLPQEKKHIFQKVLGELLQEDEIPFEKIDPQKTITVGDVVTKTFLNHNCTPTVAVVDLVVEREKKYESIAEIGLHPRQEITIQNPASTINPELFNTFTIALHDEKNSDRGIVIRILGEEDLVVLPAVLCSPLGYTLFYGQPKEGVVMLRVTEEAKKHSKKLMSEFEIRPIE